MHVTLRSALDRDMNSKKLECFEDDDSVDGKPSLSFLGKVFTFIEELGDVNKGEILLTF